MKILIVIVRSPMAICVLSLTAGPVRTVRGPGRAVAVSRFALYRYRWPASMDTAGLNRIRGGVQYHPTLKAVRSTRSVDRGWLRMLPGQTVEDWAKVSDRLCQTFGALDCRVRTVNGRPHELELWFLTTDPLSEPVNPEPLGDTMDLDALPVGRCEDGSVYRGEAEAS